VNQLILFIEGLFIEAQKKVPRKITDIEDPTSVGWINNTVVVDPPDLSMWDIARWKHDVRKHGWLEGIRN
jgi:hypothetical protein